MIDLSQVISEPTCTPDQLEGNANTLDLFHQTQTFMQILLQILLLVNLIVFSLHFNLVSHQDRSFSSQKMFHYNKADWDALRTQFNLIWIFYSLPINLLAKNICQSGSILNVHRLPKLKTTTSKEHHYTPQYRASFVQARNLCSKTINNAKTSIVNHISNRAASCQSGYCSFWSLAKVFSQSFAILLSTSKKNSG